MAERRPERTMTFRLRGNDLARLDRLTELFELNKTDVVRTALRHLLASRERGETIHQVVPSEAETRSNDAADVT